MPPVGVTEFRSVQRVGSRNRSWAVATTCGEWRAAHHAEKLGFPFYLPRTREWRAGREHRVFLFPGVIFLRIGRRDWTELARLPREVLRLIVVPVDDERVWPAQIANDDVERLRCAEDEDGFVRHVPGLAPGDRVIVREGSGPYEGVRGVVHAIAGPGRVDVLLWMIGRQFKKQFAESQLAWASQVQQLAA